MVRILDGAGRGGAAGVRRLHAPARGMRRRRRAAARTAGVSHEDQRRTRDPAALFRLLREAAGRAGVFVSPMGDLRVAHLGHRRGCLPRCRARGRHRARLFIVINDNDAQAARPFSLMHELAHILIGASGVSGPLRSMSDNAIERFCNNVAGGVPAPGVCSGAGERQSARANGRDGAADHQQHCSRVERVGGRGHLLPGRQRRNPCAARVDLVREVRYALEGSATPRQSSPFAG